METASTRKRPQPVYDDVEHADDIYTTRMPSSTRRYKTYNTADDPTLMKGTLIQRRRSSLATHSTHGITSNAVAPTRTEPLPAPHARGKHVALIAILAGMAITVVLLISLSALIPWWQNYQNDLHYGYPRTSQLDAVVGHDDSTSSPTHFIFLNLHGHIEVIEIPGGNPALTRAFSGPTLFGSNADLPPVTGTIRDDHGHYDLILHVQNQQIVFLNDGTTFHLQS